MDTSVQVTETKLALCEECEVAVVTTVAVVDVVEVRKGKLLHQLCQRLRCFLRVGRQQQRRF